MKDLTNLLVSPTATLRELLEKSNLRRVGILLVVDADRRLLGVVTDGDIRRLIVAGKAMETVTQEVLDSRGASAAPITASDRASHAELVEILRRTSVSHIPLLDDGGRVTAVVTPTELLEEDETMIEAVVMAGGRGSRLMPLTQDTPKPMLPVGGKPIIEHILGQLQETGIRNVHVATHHQAEKIEGHLGDGEKFGVTVRYLAEDSQQGTAGGLSLLSAPANTLLVINGDILTQVDFRAMHAFHREQSADLTIAVREVAYQVPYGVVETEGARVMALREKPVRKMFVNAGIYMLEPKVHALVPANTRFDMTDLINEAISRKYIVASFPVWEYWRDIGRLSDYAQAEADVQNGRLKR